MPALVWMHYCKMIRTKGGTARRHSAATATFFHVEMLHTTWLKVKEDSGVLMLGILFSFPPLATVLLWA